MATSRKSSASDRVTKTTIKPTGSLPSIPTDLNNVILPSELQRSPDSERKLFDGTGIFTDVTFDRLLYNYHHFDILTYSISPMAVFSIREITRLIYHVGTPPRKTRRSVRVSGTHAKLWICYPSSNENNPHVFIGSANTTSMTLHELVVRLVDDQARAAIKHFNKLWEANS